jgi:hypothetical protein
MTSNQHSIPPWHAPLAWFTRFFRRVLQHRADSKLEGLAVQSLSELDDYQLWDIGLTRSDIRSAAAGRLDDRTTVTRAPHGPRLRAVRVQPTSTCGRVS